MKSNLCQERAHAARGSNFLLLRQQQVTKEKATPTFAPCVTIARFEAKTSRGPKLATLKQQTASSTFSLQISGANTRGSRRTDSCSLRNEDYGNPDASIRATLAVLARRRRQVVEDLLNYEYG